MRFITLIVILILVTACGSNTGKADQQEASSKLEYLQKGKEIVDLSQAELLKNVAMAMKSGGPGSAVDFCNIHALGIKDSLSKANDCHIRRISQKYRNPEDKPRGESEIDQLALYEQSSLKGDTLKPAVYFFENRVEYYHPIVINNGACLLCHGNPGVQITDETLAMIQSHYPDDLATGFAMNDFRGAWKITFQK